MKYFSSTPKDPVVLALIQVIQLTDDPWEETPTVEDAKIVFIIDDRAELARLYRKDRVFLFFSTRPERNLPDNVKSINLTGSMLGKIANLIQYAKDFIPPVEVKKVHAMPEAPVKTRGRYRLLVIDDTPENLAFAMALLGQDHDVVTAAGFAEGMALLKSQKFNFVLSDMQMPANKHYPALANDAYRLDETYAYGMLAVFEVTSLGIPIAIVTDANHHGDWMAAALDHLKKAEVNGQPALFFNDIGKRWDKALAALEEATDASVN